MPSWNKLLAEVEALPDDQQKANWLVANLKDSLQAVSDARGGRNVIFYASAFLQKPAAPPFLLQLTHEEINGFMSVMHGMDWDKNLTLLLHTPGGVTNAAETLVAYLWSKFPDIEVIVPTYAMSAGTMISLAANRIIMGRQSQLGPIDPQIPLGGRFASARAIVAQFQRASSEIMKDLKAAHLWAPMLQTAGPSLLQEAQDALDYGEAMVARWMAERMFNGNPDAAHLANKAANHFNAADIHKSHGQRIDRQEARSTGLEVLDLEENQQLQEVVLTAYHVYTIAFEKTPAAKIIASHTGTTWVKNIAI